MGGLIAVAAYFTPFSILRALGDSKTPLTFLVLCSLLNIVLDLLFVVVFKTGVEGAAIATVLFEAIAAVLCEIPAHNY
ncbi:MAG: polysaccharide biosynthesis C-terminal domain-containing protein [Ruminococcus bovis]|nr:polysaccharide biosynthesis C-terminal domain-containing protein [Ruminococcus bovis]MDY3662590.1 polysaccharide biosynthesis C-terminal domain-containing protein [Ruminococcus bovis]